MLVCSQEPSFWGAKTHKRSKKKWIHMPRVKTKSGACQGCWCHCLCRGYKLNFRFAGKTLRRWSHVLVSISMKAFPEHSTPLYLSFQLNREYLENVCPYIAVSKRLHKCKSLSRIFCDSFCEWDVGNGSTRKRHGKMLHKNFSMAETHLAHWRQQNWVFLKRVFSS